MMNSYVILYILLEENDLQAHTQIEAAKGSDTEF